MGEIGTIITRNATAAELPGRFRGDPPADRKVAVTVATVRTDGSGRSSKPASRGEARYLRYRGAGAHIGTTTEAAVCRDAIAANEIDAAMLEGWE